MKTLAINGHRMNGLRTAIFALLLIGQTLGQDRQLSPPVKRLEVDVQPLAANVSRLVTTLENIGYALKVDDLEKINKAIQKNDAQSIQESMDQLVSLELEIDDVKKADSLSAIRSDDRPLSK